MRTTILFFALSLFAAISYCQSGTQPRTTDTYAHIEPIGYQLVKETLPVIPRQERPYGLCCFPDLENWTIIRGGYYIPTAALKEVQIILGNIPANYSVVWYKKEDRKSHQELVPFLHRNYENTPELSSHYSIPVDRYAVTF